MDDSKLDSNTKDSSSNISASLQSADNTTGNQLINSEHIDIAPNSITEFINQKPCQSEGTSLTLLTGQNAESQASNKPDPTCTPAAAPLNEQRTKPDPSDICGLCNCVLSAPRILSCFHVYDLHCLAARLTSSQNSTQTSGGDVASGAHLQCPHATCRIATPLVPPGLAGLTSLPPDNALLLQLISKAARAETREAYRLKCSACVANEPACSLCIDCPALLCPKALESHKLLFSFLTHRVLPFEQILAASALGPHDAACGNSTGGSQSTATAADAAATNDGNETAASSDSKSASVGVGFSIPERCKSHHSPFDRYCIQCQRLVCEKCAVDGEHRAHRTESLAAFFAPSGAAAKSTPNTTAAAAMQSAPVALQSRAMGEALAPVRAALDALAGRTLKQLKYTTDIVESITESDFTEAIQMQYDRLHEILKQRQEEMLRELNTYFTRYASRREQEVAAWKSSVAQIETSRDFIQRQLSSGSALSVLSLLPLMRERLATLSREVNERCREVLAMEAQPRSEEALVRRLYGLEFKFDVDSFADAARRHLCVIHYPPGGLGATPAASAAALSAAAARGGAGGNSLGPPIGATVRTVNVLSAPVVANSARAGSGSSLRARQVQTARAMRVQSSLGDAVVVQSGGGVPAVVLPGNPIVRVMPGVPVAVSLQHLASVGSASGIRPASVTCSLQPPHPFSTTTTTPTATALMANAAHEQSARGPSVEQRPSTRTSDEVSRGSPSNLDLYPRGTVHQLEVKHEAIDGGAQASKQLYGLRPRRSSSQRSRGLFGPDFITNAYDNVMGDEEEAERESDASPSPKRRTRHYHSRSLTPAALDSSASNAQPSGSSANPLPMASRTADVQPPNGSLPLSSDRESRHSLPTAQQAPAKTSVSSAVSQVGVLTPTVSSCGTVTKTKSLLKARSALRKVNLQPSPTAGSAPAVEGAAEGGPPAPKLRPWNHMPPEVKQFTKFHPKPINQYRCLPCNKWFGRDTKRLIHHVRSAHMATAAGTSFSAAEFASIDAVASTPDHSEAAADSSMASTSTSALTLSAMNDSSKVGAKEFASDTSASSVRRNSDASVDSKPLASLAANTTQSKNSLSSNTSSVIAKRRNDNKQRPSSGQLKEPKGATGTTNKRPKKKHRRLTLARRSRVSKPLVSACDTAATSDRLFADFSESAAASSNSTKAAASQLIDAAPERALQSEASQSASTSAEVGERDLFSSTIDESKSKQQNSSLVSNKLPSRASHPKNKKNFKSASSTSSSDATHESQTNGSGGRSHMPLANLADASHPGNYILYFLKTAQALPTPDPLVTGARKESKEKKRRQRIRWYECVLCSTRFGHDRIKGFDHVNAHHKDVLQRAREGVIHQKIAHLFAGAHHSTASATATTTSSSFPTAATSAPNGPQSADVNQSPQKHVAPKSEAAGAAPHQSSGESSEEATSPLDVLADAAAAVFASVTSNETSTPIGPSARSVVPSRRSSPPKKKKRTSRSPGEKAGNARRVKGTEQVQCPLKVEEPTTVSDASTTAVSEMHSSGSVAMVVQPTSATDANGATAAVAESTPLRSPTRSHSRSNSQASRPASSIDSHHSANQSNS